MAGPLLETKLHVPRRRRSLVPRPRLSERLSSGAESTLTLVSAPAGFGKTTLLAEWLAAAAADGRSVAWLSLDQRDNDPAMFWTYVVAALRTAAPAGGASALSLLQPPQPPIEAGLVALLNDLDAMPDDVVLVLDDYHVIDARDVHDGMTFLLEHLPPQLHLVIATRADPPLPLARLRARGELVEIRAADLRFTPDEAADVPQRGDGTGADGSRRRRARGAHRGLDRRAAAGRAVDAGPRGRRRVHRRLRRRRPLHRRLPRRGGACSASPTTSGSFLLQTSILDRLSGPLCDAVTGQAGGKAMLEALERANLFLVPLDDRRRWYRYHHLFADVLQAHLLDEQPDEVPELHRRASAGTSRTASRPRRSATRWPRRTSSERRTWSSWRCRRCAGAGRRPTLLGWLERCPTRWSAIGRCSASALPGRCWLAASSTASRHRCWTPSGGWTGRPDPCGSPGPSGGDGRRRRGGVPPPPGGDRAVPGRAGAGPRRRAPAP